MLFGQEHVRRYQQTDGAEGHEWQGATVLILTTTGRNSGEPRSTPLIYRPHGDDYVIVASKGGFPVHPAWYLNLLANPEVTVQIRGEEGILLRSRLLQLKWRKLSEWPAGQPRP